MGNYLREQAYLLEWLLATPPKTFLKKKIGERGLPSDRELPAV
jgi:hypothetical protein